LKEKDSILTVKITPSRSALDTGWSEIIAHRELLFFLTFRDIKVRYKQTVLGVLWVVLQPVLTTAIIALIFSSFARFESLGAPYPLFVLSGMIVWLFVHTAVTMASNSLVANTNLVTKVYFPRLIVPLASALACLFDLLITLPILAVVMVYYGVFPSLSLLFAPVFLLLAVIQTAAIGVFFSALNVRFRDVKFALPFGLQVWMISSPLFYPASLIPGQWRLVFALNPLTGIVEGWRSALFGTPFDWQLIGVSCASIIVLVLIALLVFRRMEDDFADTI